MKLNLLNHILSLGTRVNDPTKAFDGLSSDEQVFLHVMDAGGKQVAIPLNFVHEIRIYLQVRIPRADARLIGAYKVKKAGWTMFQNLRAMDHDHPLTEVEFSALEEKAIARLIHESTEISDETPFTPDGMEIWVLHLADTRQEILVPEAGEFFMMPERVLGRFFAPVGLAAEWKTYIDRTRELSRPAHLHGFADVHFINLASPGDIDLGSRGDAMSGLLAALSASGGFATILGSGGHEIPVADLLKAVEAYEKEGDFEPLLALYQHDPSFQAFIRNAHLRREQNQEGTDQTGRTAPAPGMGAREGKDGEHHPLDERASEPPYVTAGLAGTRRGQAESNIG